MRIPLKTDRSDRVDSRAVPGQVKPCRPLTRPGLYYIELGPGRAEPTLRSAQVTRSLFGATLTIHRQHGLVATMCEIFAGQKRSNYQYQTRSIRLNGQCTSVRLEYKFWKILDKMAASESLSTPQFISRVHTEVMALHGESRNFSSLLRCACLVYLEHQADLAIA